VRLIAVSILVAGKLAHYEGGKRVPATVSAIDDAIRGTGEGQGLAEVRAIQGPKC
jgi:hypothetical protein